jgi:SAM-dependent methyltransferase
MRIEIHPAISERDLKWVLADSLCANELDPKLLYVTPRQTALWREVFLKHSPIHGNPEFGRIYREALARVADDLRPGRVRLVGLGCGTGLKEAELCARLRERGHEVEFSAIDVSRDLVDEAAQRLDEAGARSERHLTCDLAEVDFLKQWLDEGDREVPRLFTFFGLVPNLTPPFVARLMRELLRPGDIFLVSVHLAPIREGISEDAAMKKILPQYDNPETLAWLREALREWKLTEFLSEPVVIISDALGIPAIRGVASWNSEEPIFAGGDVNIPEVGRPLEVFRSLRYTPSRFTTFLLREGFRSAMLAITACREEAIWAVRAS